MMIRRTNTTSMIRPRSLLAALAVAGLALAAGAVFAQSDAGKAPPQTPQQSGQDADKAKAEKAKAEADKRQQAAADARKAKRDAKAKAGSDGRELEEEEDL